MPIDKGNLLRSNIGRWGVIILTLIVSYAAFFGAISLATQDHGEFCTLLVFLLVAFFAYWGWRSLNRITPDIFLFMPIGGWFVYLFVKFLISVVIGMFVGPFKFGCWLGDIIFGKLADSDILTPEREERKRRKKPEKRGKDGLIEEVIDKGPGDIESHGSWSVDDDPAEVEVIDYGSEPPRGPEWTPGIGDLGTIGVTGGTTTTPGGGATGGTTTTPGTGGGLKGMNKKTASSGASYDSPFFKKAE